jgi:hypothetical protein
MYIVRYGIDSQRIPFLRNKYHNINGVHKIKGSIHYYTPTPTYIVNSAQRGFILCSTANNAIVS